MGALGRRGRWLAVASVAALVGTLPLGSGLSSAASDPGRGGAYTPVVPARLMDTRKALGAAGPVAAGRVVALQILGRGSVPTTGVAAVVLDVTVTQPKSSGYITVFPAGGSRPPTSNLDFSAGQTISNLVVAPVGSLGDVDFYNGSGGTVQLVADATGWFASGGGVSGGGFLPVSPARLMDTRANVGATGPVGPGHSITLIVGGRGGIASTAAGVVLNVTVTQPKSSGYITVFADGASRPPTSSLDFGAGQTIPNLVVAPLGPDGAVDFYNGSSGTVQLVADVMGSFSAGAATSGGFASVGPARLMDTRTNHGATGPVQPGQSVTLTVAGIDGIAPSTAAVVLNVTVTQPKGSGYITVFAHGSSRPTASSLNFNAGQTIPNLAVASLGSGGAVDFYNGSGGTVQLIADAVGSLAPDNAPVTLPDMQLEVPTGSISIGAGAAGQQLQFTHVTWDAGAGPFEIDPTYDPSTGTATFTQAVYNSPSPGVWNLDHYVPLAVTGVFNPPSDYQFPLTRFTLNQVNPDGSPGAVVATSPKTDYCITADAFVGGVPNTPNQTYIPQSNCTDPNLPLGWSVGFGDQYDQTDSGQPISLVGVPDGTYILRGIVDPDHLLAESTAHNNETDTRLQISGGDSSVAVLSQTQPNVTPPSVGLLSPSEGATVSGTVDLTVDANSNSSATIASIQYLLDGEPLGSALTTAPYTYPWTVGTTPVGPHFLSARITDSNGNMSTATSVTVSVTTSGGLAVDKVENASGSGPVTTSPFSTMAAGETLVAFVDSDGPTGAAMQTATVSGAGLAWSLVKRSNSQSGDAEIWAASSPTVLTNATVTSTPAAPGFDELLTVVSFVGSGGVGASGAAAGATGAPTLHLTSTAAGSLAFATGTDFDSASARSLGSGQSLVSQWVDSGSGNTFWTQDTSAPIGASGQPITLGDVTPTTDEWDLAGIEVRPASRTTANPPAVSLMNPTSGETVSATVPVAALVRDDVGISSVQFFLDGRPFGRAVTSAPYALRWTTAAAAEGRHVLSARATDTSGHVVMSAPVAVTVQNPAPPMTCFVMQAAVSGSGTDDVVTPAIHTVAAGEVLVAFVSARGPVRITGAGVEWKLVGRANARPGDSEVWTATAPKVLDAARIDSKELVPGSTQNVTVIAMEGVSGVGAVSSASGRGSARSVAVTTRGATSLVFAVGDASTSGSQSAPTMSLPFGWVFLDKSSGSGGQNLSWNQYTNDPTGPSGSMITLNDALSTDANWNLVAIELLNDDG